MADEKGKANVVAVLGAGGTMGLAMARNIARAGLGVRAWDRHPEKADALKEQGATVCQSAAEACQGAGVVVTMLPQADAVLESMEKAVDGLEEGGLWLQMSTVGEDGAKRCGDFAAKHGLFYVDAPVVGSKAPAEEGKLTVLASGPQELRDQAAPVLEAVGQRTLWLGEAGAGQRLKLVVNSWVLTVSEAAAELTVLAKSLGLDPAQALEAIAGGPTDMPYLKAKMEAIAKGDFSPQFRLSLAAKDARLITEMAERRHVDLPLFEAVARQMSKAEGEHGDEDVAATYFASA